MVPTRRHISGDEVNVHCNPTPMLAPSHDTIKMPTLGFKKFHHNNEWLIVYLEYV
jgi:hypothetical protein